MYRRCNELPLDRFLTCLIDGDLSALIIEGEPPTEQLATTWGEIFFEYIDLSDEPQAKYAVNLEREIAVLSSEITAIETALYFLSPVMIPFTRDRASELVAAINQFGYSLQIDITDPNYPQKLQAMNNRLAPKRLKLKTKTQELKSYIENRSGETPERSYYTKWLVRLARFQGVATIRPSQITVEEFMILMNEYNQEAQRRMSQKEEGYG